MTNEFGGTQSELKLACVEDYIAAYLQVMQRQTWCQLHYVDAFAGAGWHKPKGKKDKGGAATGPALFEPEDASAALEFIVGSPVRAVRASHQAARGFDRLIFIERSSRKCKQLKGVIEAEQGCESNKAVCLCGDANTHIVTYLERQDWTRTRAVVFLDPFGLEVRWSTIEALAATQACDVWYLFPLGVQRMITKSGAIDPYWSERLDELFGTHGWYDEFYQAHGQTSLFESTELVTRDASTDHVVAYARARLDAVFAGGTSNPAVLRFRTGSPFAALIMAVGNPSPAARSKALRIANHLTRGLNK